MLENLERVCKSCGIDFITNNEENSLVCVHCQEITDGKEKMFGKVKSTNDSVNHPQHYTSGKIEVIDFLEDQRLNYNLGNVVKYVARADKKYFEKEKQLEDLEKAAWYLDREIQNRKKELKDE